MRKIITLLLLTNVFTAISQEESSFLLRWDLEDTAHYKVELGQININLESESDALGDIEQEELRQSLKNKIMEAFKNYTLTSKIYRNQKNYQVKLYFNNSEVLNGMIDNKGQLLTQVAESSRNLFKFFFELPEKSIKIGDTWESNIDYQLSLRNMKVIDSVRQDKVTFERIIEADSGRFAVLNTFMKEDLTTSFIDEDGRSGKGIIELIYDTTGFFDLRKGRWNRIDGFVIFDFDFGENAEKTILRVGLLEIKESTHPP